MREIASPLSGPFTTFGQTPIDIYKVGAYRPELAYSFYNEYYRRGRQPVNFLDAITHTRNGNATMTDSSGNIVWAPHNLALNSATPATQSITVVSGVDYTVGCTGVSIALSGAGTGTATEGSPVEITASTTTLTLTVTGSSGTMWAYRSDLGGMADVPLSERSLSTATKYVPTTDAARYLPRVNHHVYNGSQWVNKGLLHESEARTNLVTSSNSITGYGGSTAAQNYTSPTGNTDAWTLTYGGGTTGYTIASGPSFTSGTTYNFSFYFKRGTGTKTVQTLLYHTDFNSSSGTNCVVQYDLDSLTTTVASGSFVSHSVEDVGNGWYRCSCSSTATATSSVPQQIYRAGAADDGNYDYVYGLQVEAGSTPSSYIPTSGSSSTRASETLTIPAANLPWPSPVYVTNEELVTNGTFDTDISGWNGYNYQGHALTLSHSGGQAQVTNDPINGGNGAMYQTLATDIGSCYQVDFEFVSTTTGTPKLLVRNTLTSGSIAEATTSGAGAYTTTFVATATETLLIFAQNLTSAGVTTVWDNISVKEINPLALSIQMSGEVTGDSYTPFRWYGDANNYITQSIGTSDFTFTQADGGTVDSVTGGSFTSGVNVAFDFCSTHASTLVAAAVDGTSLTDNTTPVALFDLSSTDAQIGYNFNGTIDLVRIWSSNIAATGREEASA